MSGVWRVDTGRFASETLDGETIVMDTVAGRLTLLTGWGPVVWERLVVGVDLEAIGEEIAESFGERPAHEVVSFVRTLRDSGLVDVVPVDRVGAGVDGAAGAEWPSDYVEPGVEVFDDIADIMTMDPIHEVDTGRGWPRTDSA